MAISKTEAAQRQLDVAIQLFFADDDWIAVHTLAAASGRILRDLAEQRGSSAWDMLNEQIIPEQRGCVWRQFNRIANFFKHADKDPDDLLNEIDPMVNEHFILTNCLLFVDLERRGTRPISAFLGWYTGTHPEMFRNQGIPILNEFKSLAVSIQQDLSRAEQLALWRQILSLLSV